MSLFVNKKSSSFNKRAELEHAKARLEKLVNRLVYAFVNRLANKLVNRLANKLANKLVNRLEYVAREQARIYSS